MEISIRGNGARGLLLLCERLAEECGMWHVASWVRAGVE